MHTNVSEKIFTANRQNDDEGLDSYLVVQVPGLVVFLRALPAEDGLVVDLDQLPFRAVAEVPKKAARGQRAK